MVDPVVTGPGVGSKIISYIFIGIGFALMLVNIIMMGVNLGDKDTNQTIRKYVGLSIIPVTISLVLISVGLYMYFTANPGFLPYAAIIMSVLAIGVANVAVCVSLIEKNVN